MNHDMEGRTLRDAILHGAVALATFALVLTSASDAGAATVLTTPGVPDESGLTPACFVTNLDKKPITVTVQLFDQFTGTPLPPNATLGEKCPVPPVALAPGNGCRVTVGVNTRPYCVVTTSSAKVRAALGLIDGTTSALVLEVPATK